MNDSRIKSKEDNAKAKSTQESSTAGPATSRTESAGGSENTDGKTMRMNSDSYETTRPENTPPIRESKVEMARRRVEAGAYDSPEVRDAIVEKLVDALTG